MNHTLNTPSASWSVARFPKEVQNYAPTVKEPAMFSALRNGGGNVALNAYARTGGCGMDEGRTR